MVVYNVSRFARQTHDHQVAKAALANDGINLRFVQEQQIDDSPEGKLQENLLSAFHQYDNDSKTRRTVEGMKQAVEAGRFVHRAPIGYLTDRNADGELRVDPTRAALIRRAFELYGDGHDRG